jgi:hypothetical protein
LSWRNPDARSRRIASLKAERNTNHARERQARINRERWARPGEREKLAERNRQRWSDPEIRERWSAAIKEVQGSPEMRRFYSIMRSEQWANNPEYRARTIAGIRRSKSSPEARALFSTLLRARWQDPVWRAKYMLAVRANGKLTAAVPRPSRRRPRVPRIVNIPIPSFTAEERKVLAISRAAVQRRGRQQKSTTGDLRALIEAFTGPIKKLPAGASADWKPSWMKE